MQKDPLSGVYELSGPASIRRFFFPRQRLHITDVAPFIGICRARLYKRVKDGKLNLRIQYDESSNPFITLDDLVEYLYPADATLSPSCHPEAKRGPGRPRKSSEGGVR